MQKTPWFCERQADIMLNYLPLRNVLTWGIKAMVKNKALPDSARFCTPRLVTLSPSQTWPYQGWSHVSSLSLADAVHPEGTPGYCRGWTPASLLFSAICQASSDNHFSFLLFFFFGMVWITASCTMSQTSIHSSSGTLSIRSNPLNLFVTSTV